MNTILINDYLSNLSQKQKQLVLDAMEYVGSLIDGGVVSRIFTLPGFTVDGLVICNFKVKKDKIIMRFYQKDVFAAFAKKLSPIEHGRCSIVFGAVDEIRTKVVEDLIKTTVRTVKEDAAFLHSIRLRDYGYYDNVLLKPRRR